MIEHAKQEYPFECCGLLAGQGMSVQQAYPLTNVEVSSTTYLADAKEQWRAMCEIEDSSLELLSIYHSHPHSPCYPSQRDIGMAYYDQVAYIIISLLNREAPEVKAFTIKDGAIHPEELIIEAQG
jgi:proteasome lid subunit RPN8/RPN11